MMMYCATRRWHCWYNFTLLEVTLVTCLGQQWQRQIGLMFKFIVALTKAQDPRAAEIHCKCWNTPKPILDLNPSTLAFHGNEVCLKGWRHSLWMSRLHVIPGKEVQIGCWVIDVSAYLRPTRGRVAYIATFKPIMQTFPLSGCYQYTDTQYGQVEQESLLKT